jgi:hypothetical protein
MTQTNETNDREPQVNVNLLAPEQLVRDAKALAERMDLNLSQLIRKLLRDAIAKNSDTQASSK